MRVVDGHDEAACIAVDGTVTSRVALPVGGADATSRAISDEAGRVHVAWTDIDHAIRYAREGLEPTTVATAGTLVDLAVDGEAAWLAIALDDSVRVVGLDGSDDTIAVPSPIGNARLLVRAGHRWITRTLTSTVEAFGLDDGGRSVPLDGLLQPSTAAAVDSTGHLWVAVGTETASFDGAPSELRVSRWDGAAWQMTRLAARAGGPNGATGDRFAGVSLALDASDRAHVVAFRVVESFLLATVYFQPRADVPMGWVGTQGKGFYHPFAGMPPESSVRFAYRGDLRALADGTLRLDAAVEHVDFANAIFQAVGIGCACPRDSDVP